MLIQYIVLDQLNISIHLLDLLVISSALPLGRHFSHRGGRRTNCSLLNLGLERHELGWGCHDGS